MNTGLPDRDERTQAVENASYRLSYLTLSFGLLAISAYRSFVFREGTWDLLALVIIGGGMNAAYQASRRVIYPRWAVMALVTFVLATLLAVGMVIVRRSVSTAFTGAPAPTKAAATTPAAQTATQFYLEYRAAFDKAIKLEDILSFMAAQKRKEAEAMPALVRDLGFPSMKSMNALTDVKILKEENAVDSATLTVEGVHSGKRRTGSVTMVKESGAWKIGGESWR